MNNSKLTVVVTGVDKGLGLALCTNMLEKGYLVFGGYHSAFTKTLETLQKKYEHTLWLHQVDIGNDTSVMDFCAFVKSKTITIDLLFNNAGVLGDIDSHLDGDIDFDDIIKTFNVNAVGALRMVNGLLEQVMASGTKTVVNICSEAGSITDNYREGWFGYGMSKAAMNMSGSIVHQTLKKVGGRVIQMHPGYLKTYMHGYFNDDGELTADEAAEMIIGVVEDQLTLEVGKQPVYISSKGDYLPW